jgi:outer membrane protein assembly factor BamD
MSAQPTMRRQVARVAVTVLFLFALVACGSDKPEFQERPVTDLYNGAMDALEGGEFKEASTLFDEVERQHPYSPWATKAQLMAAYSYYQADEYEDAVAALDRYIRLHPASPDVPYAHYLKALCYYEQISDVGRDQKMTEQARAAFEELIARFPDTQYYRDAKLKLDLINDHLAGKEMNIGRYYIRQKQYLAAINRFRRVIEDYQTTTHVPEALHRLVEAYTAIGLDDEARKVAAVLGHNFPGSDWYVDSYELVESKEVRPREKWRFLPW